MSREGFWFKRPTPEAIFERHKGTLPGHQDRLVCISRLTLAILEKKPA